jgi:succinyl-CoA synthetase beta subunit
VPLVITSMAPLPSTEFSRDYQQRNPHVGVVQNLALTFAALAKLFPAVGGEAAVHAAPATVEGRVLSEADSRELVEAAGVPAVRGVRVPRGADPAELAAELRPPFAVKVIAPISHKMRIGGVVLGVSSVGELATAVKQVEDAVVNAGLPATAVEGCLVEEMVFGREVLVGLNTDAVLGRYVVVGLGGSATELANRSTTRRLPLRPGDVEELLAGVAIGSHPRLAKLVEDLCSAFTEGSLAGYETVEINPVIVTADECWAADAVVTEAAPE